MLKMFNLRIFLFQFIKLSFGCRQKKVDLRRETSIFYYFLMEAFQSSINKKKYLDYQHCSTQ